MHSMAIASSANQPSVGRSVPAISSSICSYVLTAGRRTAADGMFGRSVGVTGRGYGATGAAIRVSLSRRRRHAGCGVIDLLQVDHGRIRVELLEDVIGPPIGHRF